MISQTNGGKSFNILDKTDRSLAPLPNGALSIKRLKFDWSTGGEKGVFEWIPKRDLNIEGLYQRDQCSEEKVLEIARSWDWLLLGTLSVIHRSNGEYFIFDGGHRARASFHREDVTHLPCMVHELDSINDEAKAFVARNTMISNVASFDRFKASICAAEPIALKTESLLTEFGLVPVSGGTSKSGYITCVGTLQRIVEEDYAIAKKVLGFCILLAGDSMVIGKVLHAMFVLQRHFIGSMDIIDRFYDKLTKHSQREIEIKMNQFRVECGGKGGTVVDAKAILEIINHKVRTNRLQW
jgi:hypothetical protein